MVQGWISRGWHLPFEDERDLLGRLTWKFGSERVVLVPWEVTGCGAVVPEAAWPYTQCS